MLLAPLPLDAHPRVIVDWLELSVICSEFNQAQISDLQRIWDTHRNTEDTDFEGNSQDTEDSFRESIDEEIRIRMGALGKAYPFDYSDTGEEFFLKEELTLGATAYLYCLFMSHPDKDEVISGEVVPEIDHAVRDLFQICSTIAAAGEVSGSAVSFGHPREGHSSFLTKLRETYALLGEGSVREQTLPGVTRSPKDDGMDVIAWSHSNDNAPGKYYLLGQVASGRNWPGKSVLGIIDKFHENWFEVRPVSTPNPSIFIPFHIPPVADETLEERMRSLTLEFGKVFYRLRIPLLINQGFESANIQNRHVERVADFNKVVTWVNHTCTMFRTRPVH
jgi:hypothetical protein